MKLITFSGVVAVVILMVLAFCTPAKAQFRPCVWPQTCG